MEKPSSTCLGRPGWVASAAIGERQNQWFGRGIQRPRDQGESRQALDHLTNRGGIKKRSEQIAGNDGWIANRREMFSQITVGSDGT